MAIDPEISLAAGRPPANAQANPMSLFLGQAGQAASLMNAMNQAKLFNFTMQGREGMSHVVGEAIDPEGNIDLAKAGQLIKQYPAAAHMYPEVLQALTAARSQQMEAGLKKLAGWSQVNDLLHREFMGLSTNENTTWGDVVSSVTGLARQFKESFGSSLGIDFDKEAVNLLGSFRGPGGAPAATLQGAQLAEALRTKAIETLTTQQRVEAMKNQVLELNGQQFAYNPYFNRRAGDIAAGGQSPLSGAPEFTPGGPEQGGGPPVAPAAPPAVPPSRQRGQVGEDGYDQHERLQQEAAAVDAARAPAQGADDPDAVLQRVVKNDAALATRPGSRQMGPTEERRQYNANQGEVADYRNTWSKVLDAEQQFNFRAQELKELAKKVETGAGASVGVSAASIVGTLANMAKRIAAGVGVDIEKDPTLKKYYDKSIEMMNKLAGGSYAGAQEFAKFAVQGATEALKAAIGSAGGHIALREWEAFQINNPNLDTDPKALDRMLTFAKSQLDRDKMRMDYITKYTRGGPGVSPSVSPNMESLNAVIGAMLRKHGWVEGTGPTPAEERAQPTPEVPKRRTPEESRRLLFGE